MSVNKESIRNMLYTISHKNIHFYLSGNHDEDDYVSYHCLFINLVCFRCESYTFKKGCCQKHIYETKLCQISNKVNIHYEFVCTKEFFGIAFYMGHIVNYREIITEFKIVFLILYN